MTRTVQPHSCLIVVLCFYSIWPAVALLSSSSPFGATTKNVATQILQGAGPPVVDLNQYNIPLSEVEQEWKANLVQKAAQKQAFVALSCRSPKNYVDTVMVSFPRVPGQGLGLSLIELAGGREDKLGITVVSEVIAGGAAAAAVPDKILPGDAIGSIQLVRRRKSVSQQQSAGVSEQVEQFRAQTECLGYDATVEAIGSLPVYSEEFEDTFTVAVKRIRRKPKVTIKLQYPPSQNEPDVSIELFAGENLRQAMLVRGIKLNDPLAKRFDTKNGGNCGAGGLCRTCSVAVQSGVDLLNPQRVAEKQMLADNPRWRLACKAIVGYGMKEGEMTIRVNPRQW